MYPDRGGDYWQEYFKELPRNLLIPEKIVDKLLQILKKWGCEVDLCEEEKMDDGFSLEEFEVESDNHPQSDNVIPVFSSKTSVEGEKSPDPYEEKILTPPEKTAYEEMTATREDVAPPTEEIISEKAEEERILEYEETPSSFPYWDEWEKYGFFTSLWGTWTGVLFRTDSFFKNLPNGRILNLLIYYLLFSGITLSSNLVTVASVTGQKISYTLYAGQFLWLIIIYFLIAIGLHFSIWVFGKTKGFKKTLQIVAYSSSANIFSVIPVIGFIVTFYYKIVIYVSGVANGHKLSVASSTAAVLLPLFEFIFLIVIVFLIIAAILGGGDVEKFLHLWRSFGGFNFPTP